MGSPRVRFVIGGVQKAGTSALARWLAAHPRLELPRDKEAHLFDAPDFDEQADAAQLDQRNAGHWAAGDDASMHGDATPFYLLHPRIITRIQRYNPAMRWIVLLRHPVERLVSNYHMERDWGRERRSLWTALVLERLRLWRRGDDFSMESPLRHCTYARRSDYARQLDALFQHFPAEQVLLLDSATLANQPEAAYRRVCAFLGVSPALPLPPFERVFVGSYPPLSKDGWRWRLLCRWLRPAMRRQHERYGIDWQAVPPLDANRSTVPYRTLTDAD